MAYTIIRPASHDEWLQERGKGIGSSEVGTILGVNPFDTPYQLWMRKTGQLPPVQQNEAMRAGHILEGAVATYFEEDSGRQVIKASEGDWLAIDKEREYLRVSPDRTYWLDGKHSKANKGILECKTTQIDVSSDEIPMHWFCQLMYQLGVMGYRQGTLAWLTRGRKFGYKVIDFDADFYGYMVEAIERFWRDNIVGGQEPAIVNVADAALKYPKSLAGAAVEADGDIVVTVNNLKAIKAQVDELTGQKKELEDTIKLYMGDAELLSLPGSKESNPVTLATYKTAKDSTKFDEKRFAKEHPDLYAGYLMQVQGSRRFLIK